MKILCPTCNGKGSINNPKINGPISYSGPNGETCPQVYCQSCGGYGWVEDYEIANSITNVIKKYYTGENK